MTEQTIQSLAAEALSHFKTGERTDGSTYFHTVESPEWITELVYKAHGNGDMLPDNWRYDTIHSALEAIAEQPWDENDDHAHEFADSRVDVYNTDLTAWLASNAKRVAYCDAALTDVEGLTGDARPAFMGVLMRGQYIESLEVYSSVVSSLEAKIEEEA